jgi:hypothetical protein
MIHSLPRPKISAITAIVLMGVLLISCGSYQQASYYDNDGIYDEGTEKVTVINRYPQQRQQPQATDKDGVYQDYFGNKAEQIDEIMEDEIFTDVDEYYSGVDGDSLVYDEQDNYFDNNNDYSGYAGWGDNATSVNINIYEGMGYGFSGFGTPWGWNNWGYGGYYGYGFYSPWRYRWSNPWWYGG